MVFLLLTLACAKGSDPAPSEPVPPTEVAATPAPLVATDPVMFGEAGPNGETTVLPPAGAAGDEADKACHARVEGASTVGECKTDADCARAGCSQEVCVSATVAPTLNTTCDKLPCFAELDTCGCAAGICTWTWKKTP